MLSSHSLLKLSKASNGAIQTPLRRNLVIARCSSSHQPNQFDRRDLLLSIGASTVAIISSPAHADDEEQPIISSPPPPASVDTPRYQHITDPILAYEFDVPTQSMTGRSVPLVFARKPERYSSAAPLTADARQRIVCELTDLASAITVSLSVGPPGPILTQLQVDSPSQWKPKVVAEQILVDKSTARVTNGQRVSLNSIEDAKQVVRKDNKNSKNSDGDGDDIYWEFEYVSQGSPTLRTATKETYRHSLAVTGARPGQEEGSLYLYTLSLSCPEDLYGELEGQFRHCIESFRLVEPGSEYVAPDKDPWRFF
jgi:hypothetical protein